MILLAAGRGTRFGGQLPKVFLDLAGMPLLLHSVQRLSEVIDLRTEGELIVAMHPEDRRAHLPRLAPGLAPYGAKVVDGGATRQQSMTSALRAADTRAELVLVHDAARPLFPIEAARRALVEAARVGAALLAVPAVDTLKEVAGGQVRRTLDRSVIWYAQTPQVARRDLLVAALERAEREGYEATDDAGLIEWNGGTVAVVESTVANLKITRPEDLLLAEVLLRRDHGTRR